MRKSIVLGAAIAILAAGVAIGAQKRPAAAPLPADLAPLVGPLFNGTQGCFALLDVATGAWSRYDAAACARRLPPFSTFKIVNSLIALETGVAKDVDLLIRFDPQAHPEKDEWARNGMGDWLRDHTLRSAFKYSVVWYYQELARRIGAARMAEFLGRLRYGNGDISDGIDTFWLTGSLLVSPDEQAEFMARFLRGELPLAPRTVALVKDLMLNETGDGRTLGYKTGLGSSESGSRAWLVGFVESPRGTYAFALALEAKTTAEIRAKRIELAKQILRQLGLLS